MLQPAFYCRITTQILIIFSWRSDSGQYYVLAKGSSFKGVGRVSQLTLDDTVTVLAYSYRNAQPLHTVLSGCPQLEKRSDSYSGGNAYTSSYVVKTVKYYYPSPSYGKYAVRGQYHPTMTAKRRQRNDRTPPHPGFRDVGIRFGYPMLTKCLPVI